MGTIKKRKVTVGIILSIAIIYLIIFADYSSFRRDIYFKYHSKLSLGYILGYLPKDYKLDYDENTFDSNNEFDLINIVFNKAPEYHNYIIFDDKLKNNPCLLKNRDSMFYKMDGRTDLLSSQINKECFNNLVTYKRMKNQDSISNYYCLLLSHIHGDSYKRVSNNEEFRKLLENYDEFSEKIDKELMVDENRTLYFDNYVYYWFKGMGFFEISFSFEDTNLKSVSDTFLGYVGH